MQTITTIGLEIAKSVFQVHGVDAGGPNGARHPAETDRCSDGPGYRLARSIGLSERDRCVWE